MLDIRDSINILVAVAKGSHPRCHGRWARPGSCARADAPRFFVASLCGHRADNHIRSRSSCLHRTCARGSWRRNVWLGCCVAVCDSRSVCSWRPRRLANRCCFCGCVVRPRHRFFSVVWVLAERTAKRHVHHFLHPTTRSHISFLSWETCLTLQSTPFAWLAGRCAMELRSAGHLER